MATPVAPRNESLERFRTIAFDLSMMRQGIRWSPTTPGSLDATTWFAMVPECYQPAVQRIVERVFDRNRGIKATDVELDRIRVAIRDAIFREVEPIDPADIPPPTDLDAIELAGVQPLSFAIPDGFAAAAIASAQADAAATIRRGMEQSLSRPYRPGIEALVERIEALEARRADPTVLLADLAAAIPKMTLDQCEILHELLERLGTRMIEIAAIAKPKS